MKAQFVYENISFERGHDPKSALRIGTAYLDHRKMENHKKSWEYWFDFENDELEEMVTNSINHIKSLVKGPLYFIDEYDSYYDIPDDEASEKSIEWLYNLMEQPGKIGKISASEPIIADIDGEKIEYGDGMIEYKVVKTPDGGTIIGIFEDPKTLWVGDLRAAAEYDMMK